MSRDAFIYKGNEVVAGGRGIYHTSYPAHEDYYAFISNDLESLPDVNDITDVLVRRAYTIFASYNNHGEAVVARVNYLISNLSDGEFVDVLNHHRLLLIAYKDLLSWQDAISSITNLFMLYDKPAEMSDLSEYQLYLNIYREFSEIPESDRAKFTDSIESISNPYFDDLKDSMLLSVNNYHGTTCGELKMREIVKQVEVLLGTIDVSINSRNDLFTAITRSASSNPYYKGISDLAKLITELSRKLGELSDQILESAKDQIQNSDKITDLNDIKPGEDDHLIIIPGKANDASEASKVIDNIFEITDSVIQDQITADDLESRLPENQHQVKDENDLSDVKDMVKEVEDLLLGSGGNLSAMDDAISGITNLKPSLDGSFDYSSMIQGNLEFMEGQYIIYIDKIMGLQLLLNAIAGFLNLIFGLVQLFLDMIGLIISAINAVICMIKALICAVVAALKFVGEMIGKAKDLIDKGKKYAALVKKSLLDEGEESWGKSIANKVKSTLSSKEGIKSAVTSAASIVAPDKVDQLKIVLDFATETNWKSLNAESISNSARDVVRSSVSGVVDSAVDYVKGVYGTLTDTSTCGTFNGWGLPKVNISIKWGGLDNPFSMPRFTNPLKVPSC